MGLSLSPASLKDFILSRELERRRGSWGNKAEIILRRGLGVGSTILVEKAIASGFVRAEQLLAAARENGCCFPDGLVIFSERLTAGRGRFKRVWHAPDGGLWLTLVVANTLMPESARLMPFAAGVAVCETARDHAPDARLKWVSDVMIRGRKVAGVLIETSRCGDEEFFLIGIGLNVNNQMFPAELGPTATSLARAAGGELDLDAVAVDLLSRLAWNIGLLHETDEIRAADDHAPHPVLERWRRLSDSIGRRVSFGHDLDREVMYEAVVDSLAADGSLNLRLDDGTVVNEVAGEIIYL